MKPKGFNRFGGDGWVGGCMARGGDSSTVNDRRDAWPDKYGKWAHDQVVRLVSVFVLWPKVFLV